MLLLALTLLPSLVHSAASSASRPESLFDVALRQLVFLILPKTFPALAINPHDALTVAHVMRYFGNPSDPHSRQRTLALFAEAERHRDALEKSCIEEGKMGWSTYEKQAAPF